MVIHQLQAIYFQAVAPNRMVIPQLQAIYFQAGAPNGMVIRQLRAIYFQAVVVDVVGAVVVFVVFVFVVVFALDPAENLCTRL